MGAVTYVILIEGCVRPRCVIVFMYSDPVARTNSIFLMHPWMKNGWGWVIDNTYKRTMCHRLALISAYWCDIDRDRQSVIEPVKHPFWLHENFKVRLALFRPGTPTETHVVREEFWCGSTLRLLHQLHTLPWWGNMLSLLSKHRYTCTYLK